MINNWKLRFVPLFYLLFFLSIAVIFVFFGFSFLKQTQMSLAEEILEKQAKSIKGIFPYKLLNEKKQLQKYTEDLGRFSRLNISIILPNGKLIADNHFNPDLISNQKNQPEVAQALKKGKGISERREIHGHGELLLYAVSLPSENDCQCVLRLSMSKDILAENQESYYISAILIFVIFFTIILIYTLVIFSHVMSSLRHIQEKTAILAKGQFDVEFYIDAPHEMVLIASCLNKMNHHVKNRIELITRQKNELEAILTGMAEGVIVLDELLIIREVNTAAEKIFARKKITVQGKKIMEAYRNVDLYDFVMEVNETEEQVSREIRLKLPRSSGMDFYSHTQSREFFIQLSGSKIPIGDSYSKSASFNGSKNFLVVLVFNDITQIKQLEQVRKDFVANVSHELKTPITSIYGYVETLLDSGLEDSSTAHHFLEIISKHTKRLTEIINDLLTLAYLEKNHKEKTFENNRINDIISTAASVCRLKAQEKNIKITKECSQEVFWNCESHNMEQALINLIENAIKYSPENTTVTIKCFIEQEKLFIDIVDQGQGISPEHSHRIFERFYRVDKGRSRDQGGTGLGLSIVKHIVLMHEGKISVQSKPGVGSTFRIILPKTS